MEKDEEHNRSYKNLLEKYNLDIAHLQYELLNKTDKPSSIRIEVKADDSAAEKFSELLEKYEKIIGENRDLKLENNRFEQHCKILVKKLQSQSTAIKRLIGKLDCWDMQQQEKIVQQDSIHSIVQQLQKELHKSEVQLHHLRQQFQISTKQQEEKYNQVLKQKHDYELFISLQDDICRILITTLQQIKENPTILQDYPIKEPFLDGSIGILSFEDSIALLNFLLSRCSPKLLHPLKQIEKIPNSMPVQPPAHPIIVTPRYYSAKHKPLHHHFLPRI